MKSKIPWPPAFIPVIRFDHATGLCGGMLVVKRRNDPCSRQPGEIRHLALRHELREQVRIEAIDAQNNHFPGAKRSAARVLAGEEQAQARRAQKQQA